MPRPNSSSILSSLKSGALRRQIEDAGPINLPVGRLFVEEVITECRKRGASRVDVLAFEFEMGRFPAVLDEAKHKGIDLVPKTIRPEVFDKRAVERTNGRASAPAPSATWNWPRSAIPTPKPVAT